jgi:hypothetical protein
LPSIYTLKTDIYEKIKNDRNWFTPERSASFSANLEQALKPSAEERLPTLRLSKMGPCCPRQLWYSIHHPELAETIPGYAYIKFTYGHILEHLVIELAKAAGHEVCGEQDVLTVDGIKGHRDCVIDGCVVDVKSCSSRMFEKFKDKSIGKDDPFGYLDQLDGYLVGSNGDSVVQVKDRGYILAVDKTLGHIELYEHRVREDSIRKRIEHYKQIVGRNTPPSCECRCVPDGKSGNIKLDVKASYSAFKHSCFPHLRTFLYASGPVYLTKVVRVPNVIEVDKHGKIVYN